MVILDLYKYLPYYQAFIAQSVEAVEYTDCISAKGVRLLWMSVLDMILNHLMAPLVV